MAVAQLFFPPPPVIISSRPTKPSRRYKTSFLRKPPTSFSKRPPSLRCLSTKPISAVVKDRKGFGGKLNWSDFWSSSLLSYWNEDAQADEKFLCHWAKDGTVADTKDEIREEERKINKSKRRFGVELSPKIYMVIVGVSFGVVLAVFFFSTTFASGHKVVPYSDLVGRIRDGSVTQVQFVENSRVIYFNTKSSVGQDAELPKSLLKEFVSKWQYHTRNVGDDKHQLIRMLKDKGITYGSDPELFSASMKNFLFAMLQLSPYWIMVLLSFYQINAQHNLGRMTKRKPSKKQSVTFDDVEGLDDAKAELLEIVLCINGDSNYMKLGAKLPTGVLLAGPPGTGKTLLARAVAGEAGVSFFSISASELVEVFVGAGAARVRDLFREARESSPSIIFIDEIDAVGGRRGRTLNCERDQTLNQLLTEMDGFEKDASVVVIAATNRPETLDPALMRPGRFSRKVVVGEPDEDGRRKIFALYLKDVPMQEDKEAICNLVASRTPGLVGSALEIIANESVLLAGRRGGDHVTRDDILQAVEKVTTKVYSDENAATESPYSFGSMAQGVQFGGGSMGFGFPNS